MLTGGASGYAAIHSRVRVMYSELFAPQDGASLRETADLNSLLESLKNTVYGPYLNRVEDKELTPRRAVSEIKSRTADIYLTVIHSAPARSRPVLIQLFRHFEIDNLKAVLRGIMTNSSWERVRDTLFPLGSLTLIPAQQMLEAGNVEAAVTLISATPYYDTISHAMKRYADEQSLFPLEVALDLDYWRKLWTTVKQLPGQDRTQALRIIGPLLDMNNLMWAMRYRVYHRLSEEEIINYTLPFGYHMRDEDIRAIAAGANIARVIERLYPGISNVEALLQEPGQGLPKLELQLQRFVRRQFNSVFTGYPFHIGLPLALVALSEFEIQDLTVLIEAKSAHMPNEKFTPYLLMGTNPDNIAT